MDAILTNKLTDVSVRVQSSDTHSDCHYGHRVWVDKDNVAYCEVGKEAPYFKISIL